MQGCPAKNGLQKPIEPPGNPWRINLKLYDENPIRPQEPFGCLKGLERVHIIVDSDIGEVGGRGVRIKQRENDQVKAIVAVLHVIPRIVPHALYQWRAVGLFKMELFAQLQDQRVDLHSSYVPGAVSECGSHIVSHSSAQD